MSTNEVSPKWMNLRAPTITDYMTIPIGTDKNNYIVIDWEFPSEKLNCVYKYNVNIDKWSKIDGLNNIQNISVIDKWSKIDGLNNIQNILLCSQ
eukprot:218316_1